METAYNEKDAIKNEARKMEYEYSILQSAIDSIRPENKNDILTELRAKSLASNSLKYHDLDFQYYLIRPTESSLSAIGAAYGHKHFLGKIAIAISIGLSLASLLFWTFLQRRKLGAAFILVNIFVLGVFIFDSILTDVSLLFGAWTLLGLLVIQLWIRDRSVDPACH
jgi:hypothetical protein